MIKTLAIDQFIKLDGSIPVVDVRTPAEFEQGHIPAAYNIPLFTNEERVKVGTTYKQQGREPAILLGFDLTGSKWSGFIKEALKIAPDMKIAVHCWRGGMRSGAMAWAFNLYGFDVYLLEGGYKKYRRWVLDSFEQQYNISVIGGMTGSGKTHVLHQLSACKEQVIDLEDIAQHQGSSFGTMDKLMQPTQEQFENDLAAQLDQFDRNRTTWIEDESLTIGKRFVPNALFKQMREAPVWILNVPLKARVKLLAAEYGKLRKAFLIECTERIWKRLGPEQTKNAVLAINDDRMEDFIEIVLVYYDKTYKSGLGKRSPESIIEIITETTDAEKNAAEILKHAPRNAFMI